MWRLEAPSLPDALADVNSMVRYAKLPPRDAAPLKCLIQKYHELGGQVSAKHLVDISEDGAKQLLAIYERRTRNRGRYRYIRDELTREVYQCPCCGINQPATLDHYAPKEKYPQLAACRLNLVPMCYDCNNAKSDQEHPDFVHPYYFEPYETFSEYRMPFLEADMTYVDSVPVVLFRIVRAALRRDAVYNQVNTHWRYLGLNARIQKSVTSFLRSLLLKGTPDHELSKLMAENIEEDYGLNDWRSAVMRALVRELSGENQEKCRNALLALNKMRIRDKKV